jgi:hypothetical protein
VWTPIDTETNGLPNDYHIGYDDELPLVVVEYELLNNTQIQAVDKWAIMANMFLLKVSDEGAISIKQITVNKGATLSVDGHKGEFGCNAFYDSLHKQNDGTEPFKVYVQKGLTTTPEKAEVLELVTIDDGASVGVKISWFLNEDTGFSYDFISEVVDMDADEGDPYIEDDVPRNDYTYRVLAHAQRGGGRISMRQVDYGPFYYGGLLW